MDKKMLESLKRRAIGYTKSEATKEFTVDEHGRTKLVRVKKTEKYYPPEHQALRLLLEISNEETGLFDRMTDEELAEEKRRLIRLLD